MADQDNNSQHQSLTREQWRETFALLREAARPDLKQLQIAVPFMLCAAILEALGPWFGKTLIDKVLIPKSNDFAFIMAILVGALVTGIAADWIRYFQLRRLAGLAMRSVQRLREKVYSHVLRLPMSYFDSAITGQVVSRVTNDTEAVKALYVQVLFVMMEAAITIFGIFAVMLWINWKLAMVALLLIPTVVVVVFLYQRASAPAVARARQLRSDFNAQMAESINGMPVLQATNATIQFAERFAQTNRDHYQAKYREVKANAWLLRPMLDAIKIILLLAIIWAYAFSSAEKPLTADTTLVEIGVLYAFINYMGRIGEPLINITVQFAQFQISVIAASRVNTLLQQSAQSLDLARPNENLVSNDAPTITQGAIQFKNLSFSYGTGPVVLHNISLAIPSGAYYGIVGHTGSGKSTLLSLLLRYYTPPFDSLTIDSFPIDSFNETSFRTQVGLVPQEPFLLAASAFENIAMGRNLTLEQVVLAAKQAQVHDFIEVLDQGYNTPLGEGGARLSVGQKQLIAIARALVGQPKILLLDEATSHIDSESEILVQSVLNALKGTLTVISVAHRLSTIRDADAIVVLNHGMIAEQGTHSSLMAIENGIYARLFELQTIELDQTKDTE
jgi:ATP-binding cassette subfamily B multidrug efflux pump